MDFAPKKKVWLVIIFLVIAFSAFLIYFNLIYSPICESDKCFSDSLAICKRSEFTKDAGDAVWDYEIRGPSKGNSCEVYVRLAQLKRGSVEVLALEDKDMTCYLPLGVVASPQKEIDRCHGELREEIQSLLIQKMHSYLLENIGQISEEFKQVI